MNRSVEGAPTWAVIDIQTTGLSPKEHRIAEIAVVVLDERGYRLGQASTLVDPEGDLGPVDGHGISPEDIVSAPRFAALSGWLAEWLKGKVVVGHNLLFTTAFLDEEFRRAGVEMPHVPAICTMTNAPRFLPSLPGRTLEQCCAAAGIRIDQPRSALANARAAAQLFKTFLAQRPVLPSPWVGYIERAQRTAWPRIPMGDFRIANRSMSAEDAVDESDQREEVNPEVSSEFVVETVEGAPRAPQESESIGAYLGALDNAVSDRVLSFTEAIHLKDLAGALAIFETEQEKAHRSYVRTLAATAWSDHQVTDDERNDLLAVGRLLDLPETEVDGLIEETRPDGDGPSAEPPMRRTTAAGRVTAKATVPAPVPAAAPSDEYAEGWYPDPYGQQSLRWYDGQNWTHHTHA
jgi:DNA polymerase-3 subunit epsilon